MNRTVLIAVALALVLPSTALAKKGGGNSERLIKVSKGTKQLGGTATLDITSLSGNTSWVLNINPSGGYFVSKGVEVLGGVNLDLTDGSSSWSVEGGLRYFFDMNPMWAYAGGEGATAAPISQAPPTPPPRWPGTAACSSRWPRTWASTWAARWAWSSPSLGTPGSLSPRATWACRPSSSRRVNPSAGAP